MPKILMILSIVLIVGTLAKWGMDSKDYGEIVYYTKTSKTTIVKDVDPMFGTTIEKTSSQPGHWLGLLDIEFPFGALPMCGAWAVLGMTGFFLNWKAKKNTTT